MTYDGRTVAGGPAQTRLTGQLEITKLTVGSLGNNSYLLRSRATGASLLIDAAADPDRLLDLCDGQLDQVLTTHGHHDHWIALADVVAATGARTLASAADAGMIGVPTDVFVGDGDDVRLGDIALTADLLDGHTPGSVALTHHDRDGSIHLFTGDTLFPGGIGNTWGNVRAFQALLDGVINKFFERLPDETWVYPGHGDDTTLGAERPDLPEWRARGW